ncbi:MAG TPA: hypothetical protein QF836_01195 [Nitrospinota bacterium]|jgi:hypothetical protein|nr:hypothetical protein [Nitrospinota bacterium]HJN01651.1 hypothetical protein [Nitrospinota bacterium]
MKTYNLFNMSSAYMFLNNMKERFNILKKVFLLSENLAIKEELS